MKQFHWHFQGYHLFTAAKDLAAARKVFTDAIPSWEWQQPEFFRALADYVRIKEPFQSDANYPIVAMPELPHA